MSTLDRIELGVDFLKGPHHFFGLLLLILFGQSLFQFEQHTAVVDQIAVGLVLGRPVDARNGLQQGVVLERLVEIQHGIKRRVEARQELVDYDDDVWTVAVFKGQ